jgi:hypothetical protein
MTGKGIMRREDYAGLLGVNPRSVLSNADRRGLTKAAAREEVAQDYRARLYHQKMLHTAEGTVTAIGYVGVMVRAGDAEVAMNPSAAPYVQQILSVGSMGLAHTLADMAS